MSSTKRNHTVIIAVSSSRLSDGLEFIFNGCVTSDYTFGFGFIIKEYLKHCWYIDRQACTRPHALTRAGFAFVLQRNSAFLESRFAWAVLSAFSVQVAELIMCTRFAD